MILLPDEDRKLLRKMESQVSKETMSANFDELMQYPPLHSGSPEEEQAIQVLRKKLVEYGLSPRYSDTRRISLTRGPRSSPSQRPK